jgi:hypothetical protein
MSSRNVIELKGLHQKRPDGSIEIFGLKQSKALKLKLIIISIPQLQRH